MPNKNAQTHSNSNKNKQKNQHNLKQWLPAVAMAVGFHMLLASILFLQNKQPNSQPHPIKTKPILAQINHKADDPTQTWRQSNPTAPLQTQSEIVVKNLGNHDATSDNIQMTTNRDNAPILDTRPDSPNSNQTNQTTTLPLTNEFTNGEINDKQIQEQIHQINNHHTAQQQAIKDEYLLNLDLPNQIQQQNQELLTGIDVSEQSDREKEQQIENIKQKLNDANVKISEQLEQIRQLAQQQIEQDRASLNQ